MNKTFDIEPLILSGGDRTTARKYLADVSFFDADIMRHHDEALRIWRSVAHRYAAKESSLEIPFSLAETPKLYALDALCIASSLIEDKKDLVVVSELFTVFYLMTHFFDDHVEHPDKFFSKFDFSSSENLNTQYGAAPFAFLLISFSIINDILNEAKNLSDKSKSTIQGAMHARLAVQTRHFTGERTSNLNVSEVLEMKARRVNGQTLGVLADILREFLGYNKTQFKDMETGLLHLGAMEQFTDDIRDIGIDTALRNANIIVSANRFGVEAGAKKVADLYREEAILAEDYLTKFFNKSDMSIIFSLPFYPFMVDKAKLEQMK